MAGWRVAAPGAEAPAMKNIKVYVITTPQNKTLVRTTANERWYAEREGYTITTGWMNWKAARAIAGMYREAAS